MNAPLPPMVDLAAIRAAQGRIAGHVARTPLIRSAALSQGGPVFLKLETRQPTGSFKLRGATNAVLSPGAEGPGFAAASTGNHGRALAYAAKAQGARAVICMSRLVPANKVEAIGADAYNYGAKTVGSVLVNRMKVAGS